METRWEARWAIGGDTDAMVEILREGYPEENWTGDDVLRFLRNRCAIAKVVEDRNRANALTGVALYVVQDSLPAGNRFEGAVKSGNRLKRLAVSKKFRRMGAGTHLLGAVFDRRTIAKRKLCFVKVGERDLEAQLFLKANGFLFAPPILRRHYGDDQDAYCFYLSESIDRIERAMARRKRVSK